MADHFIQKAIKHPGALTAKAKAAGMSIDAFARKHQHDGDETGRQARFYLQVLKPASKRRSGGASLAAAAANK